MALLPYSLRPAVIIRRKALRQGLLGPSVIWKIVAAWVYGRGAAKKFFGKQPELLGTWRVGSNKFVNVINAKPTSKKQRRRSGLTRRVLIDRAVADARAVHPNKKIVVKTK
jgi:hypothetical protein